MEDRRTRLTTGARRVRQSQAHLRQCDRLGRRPGQLCSSANSHVPHHADGRTTHFLNTVGYPGAVLTDVLVMRTVGVIPRSTIMPPTGPLPRPTRAHQLAFYPTLTYITTTMDTSHTVSHLAAPSQTHLPSPNAPYRAISPPNPPPPRQAYAEARWSVN